MEAGWEGVGPGFSGLGWIIGLGLYGLRDCGETWTFDREPVDWRLKTHG